MQAMEVCIVDSSELEINNNHDESEANVNKKLNRSTNIPTSLNGNVPRQVSTLQELIGELHQAFATDVVDIDHVQELMASYKSNPHDWRRYAKFDRYRYTRNLVDVGNGKFNLIVLCWGEGHGSAIHDHADAHCVMKVLQGELAEVRYAWPGDNEENSNIEKAGEILEMDRNTFGQNAVCYINGMHTSELYLLKNVRRFPWAASCRKPQYRESGGFPPSILTPVRIVFYLQQADGTTIAMQSYLLVKVRRTS